MASASLLTFLLAGDCPTTNSLFQLNNSQAGGHLTPTFYSSHCRPKTLSRTWKAQRTPVPAVTPLLRVTQPSPSDGCFSGSTVLALSKYATVWQTAWHDMCRERSRSCNFHTRIREVLSSDLVQDTGHLHWYFSWAFQPHYGPDVDWVSNRNEYQESSWG
jgi:hypothetical protein